MKKRGLKFGAALFCVFAVCAFVFSAFASEWEWQWPDKNFQAENLRSTFAQNRNGMFSPSLVFSDANEVVAAGEGKVIATCIEHNGEGSWFESTLGNFVVVAHEKDLVSVYGNLDEPSVSAAAKKEIVRSGEDLGVTANSSWNSDASPLEFQIFQSGKNLSGKKNRAFLNPLILMQQFPSEQRILLDNITIENTVTKLSYNLATVRSVPAGRYAVYKARREASPINEAIIYLNGIEVEKIVRNELGYIKDSLSLVLHGNDDYSSDRFFPAAGRELVGHIMLPPGNSTVTVTVKDAFENERSAVFQISGGS